MVARQWPTNNLVTATLQVTKKQVDNFKTGKRIPSCKLRAERMFDSSSGRVPKLEHRMKLVGAQYPFDMFNISYIPQAATVSQGNVHMYS